MPSPSVQLISHLNLPSRHSSQGAHFCHLRPMRPPLRRLLPRLLPRDTQSQHGTHAPRWLTGCPVPELADKSPRPGFLSTDHSQATRQRLLTGHFTDDRARYYMDTTTSTQLIVSDAGVRPSSGLPPP
ncbi:hypothetical protein XA68_17006 [Ophiocordyceps unilateralis]|uniref:Uncharacterized protein n=1 Tax=Ophiocordyceps unilateralis TaxID=268505 RepID=A0A2A9P4P3_OPHUN|nr:hypothetical protein XA68_17006 [Ophiocordyceps unilateralis]